MNALPFYNPNTTILINKQVFQKQMATHILESQQFDKETLFNIFKDADRLRQAIAEKKILNDLNGKILTTLFYEPSTRTRFSFESAMNRLGGKVISTENAGEFSSASKGESLEDSIRVIAKYADCIVLRHPAEGSAHNASLVSQAPIINAGDGKGQHPTQALLDVYTIQQELKKIDGIKIAMVGDLASGRTVRSLCYLLGKFDNVEIVFVSPEHLRMKDDIKEYLQRHNVKFSEESDLNKVLPEVDVVYMTRIQKERLSIEDYEKARGKYVINDENIKLIKEDGIIMHPLPHVEEINLHIDIENKDKRVAYFRQAENGLYIRMALLNMVIGSE